MLFARMVVDVIPALNISESLFDLKMTTDTKYRKLKVSLIIRHIYNRFGQNESFYPNISVSEWHTPVDINPNRHTGLTSRWNPFCGRDILYKICAEIIIVIAVLLRSQQVSVDMGVVCVSFLLFTCEWSFSRVSQ